MKKRIIFLLMFSISILGCDIFAPPDNPPRTYPTIIRPLSEEELENLQKEFREINNYLMCSRLDRYGLVEIGRVCSVKNPDIVIEKDEVIEMAKSTLFKNRRFTNVTDTTNLIIRRATKVSPGRENTHWRIDYFPQQYEGHKVLDTQISLWAFGNGVYRINGHWYTDIFIPKEIRVNEAKAKESIIGTEITWYNAGGEEQILTVTKETLTNKPPKRVIVPLHVEDNIELRVAWEIGVSFSLNRNTPYWYVYVDVMTGELIRIDQLFVT